jgi:hypothetical protein
VLQDFCQRHDARELLVLARYPRGIENYDPRPLPEDAREPGLDILKGIFGAAARPVLTIDEYAGPAKKLAQVRYFSTTRAFPNSPWPASPWRKTARNSTLRFERAKGTRDGACSSPVCRERRGRISAASSVIEGALPL